MTAEQKAVAITAEETRKGTFPAEGTADFQTAIQGITEGLAMTDMAQMRLPLQHRDEDRESSEGKTGN